MTGFAFAMTVCHSNNDFKACNWIRQLGKEDFPGKLVLLNLLEEQRFQDSVWDEFIQKSASHFQAWNRPNKSYRSAIPELGLFFRIPSDRNVVPEFGLHFASRMYLADAGYADIPIHGKPPRTISIKKPLGSTSHCVWVTFKDAVDISKSSSTYIRNQLGLRTTKDDYLYYFTIRLRRRTYLPSVFDAFCMPPHRPVKAGIKWGMTRNLIDDSPEVPELIIEPLDTIAECSIGHLVDGEIATLPPEGYIDNRLKELAQHPEYANRSSSCK